MSHMSRPLSAPGGRPQRRLIDRRPRRHSIAPASTVRVGGRLRCISFAKWAARKQRTKVCVRSAVVWVPATLDRC